MTLTLDLTPEEETRLQALAAHQNMDLPKFARLRLGLVKTGGDAVPQTEAEWDALQAELSEGIDPNIPPLSDESLSRASIYGGCA